MRAGNLYVNRGTTGAVVLRQPFGGGIAEYVMRTGKVVNVADAYNDPRYRTEIGTLGRVPVRSLRVGDVVPKLDLFVLFQGNGDRPWSMIPRRRAEPRPNVRWPRCSRPSPVS